MFKWYNKIPLPKPITGDKLSELLQKQKVQEEGRQKLLRQLAELDASMAETKMEHAMTHNRQVPVLNLPAEMTTLVFLEAHRTSGVKEGVLTQICRSWRTIALSCPELWAIFTCSCPYTGFNRLSVYLERSRNQMLDLSFFIDNRKPVRLWVELVEKAIEQVSRWRHLSLLLDEECPHQYLTSLGPLFDPLSTPNLEMFEIYADFNDTEIEDTKPLRHWVLFREGAPKLACVRMDSLSAVILKPPSNITTLQIEQSRKNSSTFSFAFFLDLLSSSTLVNFSLSGDPFDPPKGPVRQVLASALKNFRCTDNAAVASHLWSYLRAPQLELLIIKDMVLDSYWVFPFDASAIKNGTTPVIFPSLRLLALINCDVLFFESALLLAHATKSVTHLWVNHDLDVCPEGADLFTWMAKKSPQTILWPHLDTLTWSTEMGGIEDHEFERFFDSIECRLTRLKQHCTLRLHDDDANFWKQAHSNSWKRLVKGGFFKEITMTDDYGDDDDYLAWPPRKFQTFNSTESVFYTLSPSH